MLLFRSRIPRMALILWVLALWFGAFNPVFAVSFSAADDDKLLDLVQKHTLKYFWEYAHPVSAMAPERNSTPDTVTTGGTGFGVMAWLVGIERGWLKRSEVLRRANTLVDFLIRADRFHGAWPHWMNGCTGRVIPFSPNDDGADLVETAYLMQGLLSLKAYFHRHNSPEHALRQKIERLWREVEWDWFTRGENVLYWHWSPRVGWKMNHRIQGWNECLIPYLLAASSPTHPIQPSVYHQGWATGKSFRNGRRYFGLATLPLGEDFGGPLFFSHYSFLGIDPHGLHDQYADYETQVMAHSQINFWYCVWNPKRFDGYSADCWGLTASDNDLDFYVAHSPTNDRGVITPSAALSSMPFTPRPSLRALRTFLTWQNGRLFGTCGFYDAFCPTRNWVAESYLAIDQGPIVVMIENYRTGLLWKNLGRDQDLRRGLARLGFWYSRK